MKQLSGGMNALVEKVKKTLFAFQMISPGDKALVAVSGGTDSVVLLRLLQLLADDFKLELCLVHLNHKARGADSDKDAEFVSRLGDQLGLETIIESCDVKKEQKTFKTSFQETARILRYRFFESALRKTGGNKVALGHTADDQVETVLMNFLRGSGLKGLAGIPPVRGCFIRPLIECYRAELTDFLNDQGLKFRSDSSNANKNYLRNRVRLDLIPLLENEYNANIKSNLLETSKIFRDDEDSLAAVLEEKFKECKVAGEKGKEAALDLNQLRQENAGLRKRLIRKAIQWVKGDLRSVSSRHVQRTIELISASSTTAGKEIHLPGPARAFCDHEQLIFRKIPNRRSIIKSADDEVITTELEIPGVTPIPEVSLKFVAKLILQNNQRYKSAFPNQAFLDFGKTGDHIRSRFVKPGDRFMPLGMTRLKKLKCFLIDEKVPRERRKRIPILTTRDDDIIWVYGKRISQTYRVTGKTKTILFIEGVPLE